MVASLAADFFSDADEAFLMGAARWVGLVAEHSELTQRLERNALEAGRALNARETIAVLAHDLRNYLSPVSLRLYKLRARAESDARGEDVDDTDVALRGLRRLNTLIADLLDSARLDGGVFEVVRQPVDVASIVAESAAMLATPEHAVHVQATAPALVAGDAPRLRQCLDNVLANALGHSPPLAPVHVFLSAQPRQGRAWVRIEIVDEGPGVDAAMLPQLFEQFATGRAHGVGLGLYIAKRIVTAHGGEVAVDRYPGKGARFTLWLPVLAAPTLQEAQCGGSG
jgi:signal transduction histidine kinase